MKQKSAHHMLIALRRILEEDCNDIRFKDFKEIAERTPIINFVYKTHEFLRPSWISTLMVACYGYKSYLALKISKKEEEKILFTYAFPNEVKVGEYIEKCFSKPIVSKVKHSNSLLLSPKSLLLFFKSLLNIKSTIKYLKIAHRINKKYSFMPTCRALSTICFYMRFVSELNTNKFSATLVSKSYSPDCIAITLAAKKLGIATIFCPHTFFPPVKMKKPPLSFSLIILQGEKMYESLLIRSKIEGKVIYRGIEGENFSMNAKSLKENGMKIGIFLSGALNIEGIKNEVSKIQQELNPALIIMRLHPVALASANLDSLKSKHNNLILTFGTKIEEDLNQCDLVVVGNSGVTLEVLKSAKPCVYCPTLENIDFDYNGFLESKIIPLWPNSNKLNINEIKEFYSGNWAERFKKYDASYGEKQNLNSLIKEEISSLIS